MTPPAVPVVAEVVRSGLVESRHHGSYVVLALDRGGGGGGGGRERILREAGDTDRPSYPRSSAKPLQAVGLLHAGWQPREDAELALACASHSGEPRHVDVVRRILAGAGLGPDALDNTPDLPLDAAAAAALLRSGGAADALHQNCSGKHAAMLAACAAAGWPITGYRDPDHPVQQRLRAAVEELTGERVATVGVDGCGAPLFAVSLRGLARAFARLATAAAGTPEHRVVAAMRAHPDLVGGTGRDVTALMRAVDGLVAKDGAEGVYAVGLGAGIGVAVKIEDGTSRARVPVLLELLRELGVPQAALDTVPRPDVLGHGVPVGEVRAFLR